MGKQQIRRRNKKTARINPLSNRAAAGANDQLKDTLHSEEAVIPVIQKVDQRITRHYRRTVGLTSHGSCLRPILLNEPGQLRASPI